MSKETGLIRLKFDPEFWIWSTLTLLAGLLVLLSYTTRHGAEMNQAGAPADSVEVSTRPPPAKLAIDVLIDRKEQRLFLFKNGVQISEHPVFARFKPTVERSGLFVCVRGKQGARPHLWGSLFLDSESVLRSMRNGDLSSAIQKNAKHGTIGICGQDDALDEHPGRDVEESFCVPPESLREIWAFCSAGSVVKIIP